MMVTKTKRRAADSIPKLPSPRHTPGPWEAVRVKKRGSADCYRIQQAKPRYPGNSIVSDSRIFIAELFAHRFGSADSVPGDTMGDLAHSDREGCQSANRDLIVAAPDFLEAGELMLAAFKHIPIDSVTNYDAVSKARTALAAAVAKAKGKT